MMIDCEAVTGLLGRWLDGELGPSEAEQVGLHLQECPLCLAEKERLERLQVSLKSVLEQGASGVRFEPFWNGVLQKILDKRSWHTHLQNWISSTLYPQRLAWAIPVAIVLLLAVLSLEEYIPVWSENSAKANLATVESIDGHGFNVAVFRESKTNTTVIWLYQDPEDEDESSAESKPSKPSF